MPTHDEVMRRYLVASFRERRQAVREVDRRGEFPFITISRQAGAGGGALAKAILAEFARHPLDPMLQGWSSYDRELCTLIVSDPELNVSLRELVTEEYRTRAEDIVSVMLGKSFQDDVQKNIAIVIRELALVGRAILVGRGGACITRDLALGVHIRLIAPRDLRVKQMAEQFSISETEASRRVDEQDRSRTRMVKRRFGKDIDDPELYDAVWNTGSVSLEMVARCVSEMVRGK